MRILYDHQIFNMQEYGGISRYFYEIMKGINATGGEAVNSTRYSKNVFTNDASLFKTTEFLPGSSFNKKYYIQTVINKLFASKSIVLGRYDLFHPTYYDTYFLKILKKRPFVVTFYDLIHEKLGKDFPRELAADEKFFFNRKLLLEVSSKIIAISNSTKNDIVEIYKVDPEKIVVTHLANSLKVQTHKGPNTFGDFILFVGNRDGYKNFKLFIKSIAELLIKETGLRVVCAGGGPFKKEEFAMFGELKISNKVVQTHIDDAKLSQLYSQALLFVFPSLYEGFGIPALEALECSCPTILGNTSSLPEVGQEATIYVDPTSRDDIYDKVSSLLYDESLRKDLAIKGLAQAKKFSWEKTSAATLDIYKSVL